MLLELVLDESLEDPEPLDDPELDPELDPDPELDDWELDPELELLEEGASKAIETFSVALNPEPVAKHKRPISVNRIRILF